MNRSAKKYYTSVDFIVVVCMVLVFIPLVLAFHARFLVSTMLFFAVPGLYLIIRKPKSIKRLLATILIGFFTSFALDFLAEFNGAWSWAPYGQLFFKNKILGYVTPDVMIWFLLWIFITVVFYEHFFDSDKSSNLSPRYFYAFALSVIGVAGLVAVYFLDSDLLHFRYAYLIIGMIFGVPWIFYLFAYKKRLIPRFIQASLFMVFLFLSFEVTALKLDQWRFPGEYVGMISIVGVSFPLEEFFFWIILSTIISLTCYEVLVDDGR